MTIHELGTLITGAVAILLLALIGIIQQDTNTIRMAALIAGFTYVHYFLGAGIESGNFPGKFYGTLYGVMAMIIVVMWMAAFFMSWW